MSKPFTLTINEYATEFNHSHRWVAKRAHDAQAEPVGRDPRGKPLYRLRDLVAATRIPTDPDKMTPMQRKAHWQAEQARRALEAKCATLVPVGEVLSGARYTFDVLDRAFADVPDMLAREMPGLSPHAIEVARAHCDKARTTLRDQRADRERRYGAALAGAGGPS